MSCRSVRAWLDRETESLDEGERLVLEDHVQQCEACRVERAQFALARRIVDELPHTSIGARGHTRAIAAAMMSGRRSEPQRRRVPWFAIAVPALAVGVVVAVLAVRSDDNEHARPSAIGSVPSVEAPGTKHANVAHDSVPPGQPDASIVEGMLVAEGATLAAGSALPEDVKLHAPARVRLTVYEAHVLLVAGSDVRWTPRIERGLLLDAGEAEVANKVGTSRIATRRFAVEARGTAIVTMRSVTVRNGTARVFGADGKLLATVDARSPWTLVEGTGRTQATDAAALVDEARAAYARRDHVNAQKHARAALDAHPTRTQAAEARTILADCSRALGDLDDAVTRYHAIATDFADLAAGETALFAAARLEATRKRADAARTLFEQYLDRYPFGRFADDAHRQLRAPR